MCISSVLFVANEPDPIHDPNRLAQVVAAFHHITELEAHGVNRTDVQRLLDAGYCTVESVRPMLA